VREYVAAARRLVRERQAKDRVPSIVATVVRDGRALFTEAVGVADPFRGGRPEVTTSGMSYRIGSITKTFTATLVLQLRDAGRLGLDDRLADHLDVPRHGGATIRLLLSHLSGLQREPPGEVWQTLHMPSNEELVADLAAAEAVAPADRRWHYSNLAYALLGRVVEAVTGQRWARALEDHVLAPAGLVHTGTHPRSEPAQGCLVEPYTDTVHPEPHVDGGALAPACQLWSTSADLGRWAVFLAQPDPAVLSAATLAEMCEPRVMHDLRSWTRGGGLGLMLYRRGARVLVGHGGGMPGFLAALVVSREEGVGAAVLANTTSGTDVEELACRLVTDLLERHPSSPAPWRPLAGPPDALLEPLTGRWWSEGQEWVFRVRGGALCARRSNAPDDAPWTVFAVEGPDALRAVSGPNTGERLVVRRATVPVAATGGASADESAGESAGASGGASAGESADESAGESAGASGGASARESAGARAEASAAESAAASGAVLSETSEPLDGGTASGEVESMSWATYAFTRRPTPFGGSR
jgi:CubicO group peptidase (beta-lactamase class C family)